jgi:hypothetical protein
MRRFDTGEPAAADFTSLVLQDTYTLVTDVPSAEATIDP